MKDILVVSLDVGRGESSEERPAAVHPRPAALNLVELLVTQAAKPAGAMLPTTASHSSFHLLGQNILWRLSWERGPCVLGTIAEPVQEVFIELIGDASHE